MVIRSSVLLLLVTVCKSATIQKKSDTLEILKNDVAEVGVAIENFTFDVLRDVIESGENEETVKNQRRKRSADDDIKELCQKRCEEEQIIQTQQIRDLKIEAKKLQDVVRLIQEQQEIIKVLESQNGTKQMRNELSELEENTPNVQQLAKLKSDLSEVIHDLNRTRELINIQKQKDETLEVELKKQEEEIDDLRKIVDAILNKKVTLNELLHRNEGNPRLRSSHESSARASDVSEIRKLLKSLPEDDDDDDFSSKIADLRKQLSKKRKQESFLKELKALEKSLDEDTQHSDDRFLKQFVEALKKTEPKGRDDNLDVTNLSDLQDAIDRLRPKQDDTSQFQAMLSTLINQRPQIAIPPQQLNELNKRLTPNNYPPICIVDDGGPKNNAYRVAVNFRSFPNSQPDYTKGQQFFPGQITQPGYYPQGNVNGARPEKPLSYQGETGDQKYQEDLRQQIEGLQGAIDNLNRPEYLQKAEDKAVIDDLERQIGDLRGIVDNLGYQRVRRSLDNNEVDDNSKEVEKMKKLVGKMMDEDKNIEVAQIQRKINSIKNRLDSGSPKLRSAYTPSYGESFPFPSYTGDVDPHIKDLTRSFKGDFLADIIGKIMEKVISALPSILQRILGFSLTELSKEDYQDYDIQVLYKNLGIFAYLPVIALRLLRGITAFLNMLRKNTFFKNFLMPAVILGTVAGSILFLIWWLQPDSPNQSYYITDQSDQNYSQYSSSQPVSYNYPIYSRSYFNK